MFSYLQDVAEICNMDPENVAVSEVCDNVVATPGDLGGSEKVEFWGYCVFKK